MSTLVKTEAIVLRYTPVFNTSRVVNWLTPHHGRITTLIKGSQRPKSQFIGQYDLFYTCEIIYYASDRRELHPLRECSPLEPRRALCGDWKAAACASYYADLAYRVSPPHAPLRPLYHLLDQGLDDACAHGGAYAALFHFEMKLLELLGFRPVLDTCTACGRPPGEREETYFGLHKGGLLCAHCREAEPHHCERISPAVLRMLAAWQGVERPDAARRIRCSEIQVHEITHLLGRFVEYHLDLHLHSRAIAVDILNRKRVAA